MMQIFKRKYLTTFLYEKFICFFILCQKVYRDTVFFLHVCKVFVSIRLRATYGQELAIISLCDLTLNRTQLMFRTAGQNIFVLVCLFSTYFCLILFDLLLLLPLFFVKYFRETHMSAYYICKDFEKTNKINNHALISE